MDVASKSKRRRAPPAAGLRKARREDIVTDGQYRDHVVPVRSQGDWVAWTIHARELGWEEQMGIIDRHTVVTQLPGGRTQQRKVNTVAVMRELLAAMIKPDKCDPALGEEQLRALKGPVLQGIQAYFGLDDEAAEEAEREQGESEGP